MTKQQHAANRKPTDNARDHTTEIIWDCATCNAVGHQEMLYNTAEIIEHLRTVHNMTEFEGTQTLSLALDGEEFSVSTFECVIGEVTLFKTVKTKGSLA